MRGCAAALCAVLFAVCGCSTAPSAEGLAAATASPQTPLRFEVAFSPEAGAEALVLRAIASAGHTLRLAGYSFTSPTVVKALMDAQRRGVDVRVVLDDRGNRGSANVAAINLLLGAGIQVRSNSRYAIHHDKYIVIDECTVQAGSFNYTQAAARANSENVLVVWNDVALAGQYLRHWNSRWDQGAPASPSYWTVQKNEKSSIHPQAISRSPVGSMPPSRRSLSA